MRLIQWLRQVLKKWWVWLGLLPLVLDLTSAYVPTDYIPAQISNFLEAGGNWRLTLVLVTFFLFISAFLVYSETEDRLAAYEYQEPKYELEIRDVSSQIDSGRRYVTVGCHFSMKGTTPWNGKLKEVDVYGENLQGLGDWRIRHKGYRHSAGYPTKLNLPFAIPRFKESAFDVSITSEVSGVVDPMQRTEWENAVIPLSLIIEYFTQPVGIVQRELLLDIPVNLGQQFDSIIKAPPPA